MCGRPFQREILRKMSDIELIRGNPSSGGKKGRVVDWIDSYNPPGSFFDEWQSAPQKSRFHWAGFMNGLRRLGSEQVAGREEQIRRIIRDNGITWSIYTDEKGAKRPWTMDVVPLILDVAEYQKIERALSQRLHLLNLILHDLYGRQSLLAGGKYPPQLVYGNPAFHRPCYNLLGANRRFINLYVGDLARSPDGSWWVLSDRLDAASGLGYCLENRLISTRVLPDIFRGMGVLGLQPFVKHLTGIAESLSPRRNDDPLVVLLTPGPFNQTYSEQAFLARTLGYPIVEGADLTVRNNRVYLKTTSGMRQVDVILRRLDSDWLDPLELRNDSLIGVPGLINAIRLGNVAVMNNPGAGLLETPAIFAFLPTICKALLGEDLLIPSVATWWCGQPKEMGYVLDNLGGLVIKPTFRTPGNQRSIFGPTLSKAELEHLEKCIRSNPEQYCAQEVVSQATTPCIFEGALVPRHFLLRTFMVSSGRSVPKLIPGGLGRIAPEAPAYEVSMPQGGHSKDVWVAGTSASPIEDTIAHAEHSRIVIRRSQENLPSRLADNLFWLGRYIERTESLLRGMLVLMRGLQECGQREDAADLLPLLEGIAPNSLLEHLGESVDSPFQLIEAALQTLLWSAEESASLVSNFEHITRVTQTVRERISGNTTQLMRDLPEGRVSIVGSKLSVLDDNIYDQLVALLESLAAFSGMIHENTTRGQDWYFLDIGRRIERSLALIDILWECFTRAQGNEQVLLPKILDYADSTITYRRRYFSTMSTAAVLDLVCFDAANPRSLAFQIESLHRSLEYLPHYRGRLSLHALDRIVLALYSRVTLSDVEELTLTDGGLRPAFSAFLDSLAGDLRSFSDALSRQYFSVTA